MNFTSKINSKHPYAEVNLHHPASYSLYDSLDVSWGSSDPYILIRKLGRGKYSEVFEGLNLLNNSPCAIKILKPVRELKINREIKILQTLEGGPNIIKLLDITKDPATKIPSLVFEYMDAKNHKTLFPKMKDYEVTYYMHEVLLALDFSHSMGIMHRDIKPHNILYEGGDKGTLKLIDWGLADFYFPGKEYNVRVASRYYKGPELLIDYELYDYSLDIWSLGVVFAGIIFQKDPFFQGMDNNDQLEKIVRVLGSEDLEEYIEKFHIIWEGSLLDGRGYSKKSWKSFLNEENKNLAKLEALDLLDKMLRIDHSERITAKEALNHPYFDILKKSHVFQK